MTQEAGKNNQEEKWNKIYSTEEWAKLKWELGAIFTKWIEVDGGGNIEGNPAIHRMAQYAFEYAQQREQPWVRVEDRLPEYKEEVLVYGQYGTISTANHMHGFWLFGGIVIQRVITHWMPLPAPPKQ